MLFKKKIFSTLCFLGLFFAISGTSLAQSHFTPVSTQEPCKNFLGEDGYRDASGKCVVFQNQSVPFELENNILSLSPSLPVGKGCSKDGKAGTWNESGVCIIRPPSEKKSEILQIPTTASSQVLLKDLFPGRGQQGISGVKETNKLILDFIPNIVSVALKSIAIVFLIALILAGVRFIKADDEEEGLEKAKRCLFYAIGGIVFVLSSYSIIKIIIAVFT